MSENPGVADEKETERRRDEALRRALAIPPQQAKTKRYIDQLTAIISEVRETRSRIEALARQDASQ